MLKSGKISSATKMRRCILFALLAAFCFSAAFAYDQSPSIIENPNQLVDRSNNKRFTWGNNTYELPGLRNYWHEAFYYCKWIGMEMLSIESQEEQYAIADAILDAGDYEESVFWTSLNDKYIQGSFYWEGSGKKLGAFSSWGVDEPNAAIGNDCVYLETPNYNREWFTTDCFRPFFYICKSKSCSSQK